MGEHLEQPAFIAWYGVLQLQARTFEPIARELEVRTGLPASWYEVLANLERDEAGLRMNELADDLLISRGGATKLVARLEAAGYVERYTPKTDLRATYAKITPKGRKAVDAAHPIQLALAQEYFGRFLDGDDLEALVRISSKVLQGLGSKCTWLDAVAAAQAEQAGARTAG
jgi:DNA-binding MarR family transcriptional regulator